jgi:hypothetical protein
MKTIKLFSAGVQENIDQIRLQRDIKDKSNQYAELHSKFTNLSQVDIIFVVVVEFFEIILFIADQLNLL